MGNKASKHQEEEVVEEAIGPSSWLSRDIVDEIERSESIGPQLTKINIKRLGDKYTIFDPTEKNNYYKCFASGQHGFYISLEKHVSKKNLFIIKKWDPFISPRENLANENSYITDESTSHSPSKLYFLPFVVRSQINEQGVHDIDNYIASCRENKTISLEFDQGSAKLLENPEYNPDIILMDPFQKKHVYTWFEIKSSRSSSGLLGARINNTISTLSILYDDKMEKFLTMSSRIGLNLTGINNVTGNVCSESNSVGNPPLNDGRGERGLDFCGNKARNEWKVIDNKTQ